MRFPPALLSGLLCLAASLPVAASTVGGALGSSAPASSLAASGAAASARDLAALRVAEQRRAQAVASRDVATLRNLISGDYYHVETRGRTRTKTEFLQLLSRDEYEFRSYEVDNTEIRMLDNGRAAVVTGRFRAEPQDADRPRPLRGRYVRMWVLGPEGWRNAMQQTTEIRPLAIPGEARAQH